MLFKNYSQIKYNIAGKSITLLDIFRNIAFSNVDTSAAFDDYYIQDGETPETLSAKFYGNTNYSWLIMLVNAKSSLKSDWFVSAAEYDRYVQANYSGDAIYIQALPDIQAGDVVVKVTSTNGVTASGVDNTSYRHIMEFDPYLRKIHGICGGGTFANGDQILFARRNAQNGLVTPISFQSADLTPKTVDFTTLLLVEPYEESLMYFYTSNNVVVDPYKTSATGKTAINSDTIYSNSEDTTTENNFASSVLYKYSSNNGVPDTGLLARNVGELEYDKYLKKQKIKLLKYEYLSTVMLTIENALASDQIGKKFTIEV
jgi:hypothetical protein